MSAGKVRGIRGAITVEANTAEAIGAAVTELLQRIRAENGFTLEDVAGVFFTATPDLNAAFPAAAARRLGWDRVPLLCAVEMDVPRSTPRCIRVLILVNTPRGQDEMRHVYLKGAVSLRPDLSPSVRGS